MKYILTFLLCSLFFGSLEAQLFPANGSLPPGIDWQQISNDTVRVVFPKGLEEKGKRVANLVHHMAANNPASLGTKTRKIDIFLLNRSVVSNGYVAAPPLHSKLFLKGPQESFAGTTDWLDLLTIHEYRHVMQYHNALNGVTKWLYYIFGESLWAGASHFAAPPWFWEGDAVVQETLLSHSGRGRIPGFGVYLNTIADQEKLFSYEKMVSGSYKDLIPNHYYLGYELSLHGRKHYGNDFWNEIFRDATAFRGIFWPFSEAIKAETGFRTSGLYKNMMAEKKAENRRARVHLEFETPTELKVPGSYRYPKFRTADEIIAIREDFNKEAYFVALSPDGDERKLIPVGYGMGHFDVRDTIMVWNEITSHSRWSDVSYSNLFKYDFNTEKVERLTKDSRYFSPAISPDASSILTIESDDLLNFFLTVIDLNSGEIMYRIPSPGNAFPSYPVWINLDSFAFSTQKDNRQGLLLYSLSEASFTTLIEPQFELIEFLSYRDGNIYFSTNSTNDQNHLVEFDLQSREKKVSSSYAFPYLMEMPVIGPDNKVVFINTHFNQKTLALLSLSKIMDYKPQLDLMEKVDQLYDQSKSDLALAKLVKEEGGSIVDIVEEKEYQINKYKPGLSKLKLHTWIPSPLHPNYSIQFQANDALGKAGVFLEPGYNVNEGAFFTNVNFTYAGWYPQFDLGMNTLINRSAHFPDFGESIYFDWNERVFSASTKLSHRFSKRNYFYAFEPIIGYKYIQTDGFRTFGDIGYHVAFAELSFAAVRKRAYRSIKPKYSLNGALSFQKVLNNNDKANFSSELNIFLPGLKSTHNSYLELDYRYQAVENDYLFLDTYAYAGHYRLGLSGDWIGGVKVYYEFPLWYPDIAIGPFAFFKRFRMNVNYKVDVFPGIDNLDLRTRNSVGFMFVVDATYFRLVDLPIGIGVDFNIDDGDFTPISFSLVFQ